VSLQSTRSLDYLLQHRCHSHCWRVHSGADARPGQNTLLAYNTTAQPLADVYFSGVNAFTTAFR